MATMTFDEEVAYRKQYLGYDDTTIRFIVAIERGEIDGDMIGIDEDGNPVNDGAQHETLL